MTKSAVRKLSFLVLVASSALSASALTVGIAPAEGIAYAPPPEGLLSPMGDLVSGCMDALFDAGYIATDAVVSRTSRAAWETSAFGLAEAREGRVDIVIALYAEWAPSSFEGRALLPVSVYYRLARVLDGKVLMEGSIDGPSDSRYASSHATEAASRSGASVVKSCIKMLSTFARGGD